MTLDQMREGHQAVIESVADAAEQWIHPNYRHHDPLIPETQAITSRDAYVAAFNGFKEAMPDQLSSGEVVLADGNHSAARWHVKATHTHEFRGVAPTNKVVEYWGMTIYRWEDGKVVEGWSLFDVMGFNAQMGLSPAPG